MTVAEYQLLVEKALTPEQKAANAAWLAEIERQWREFLKGGQREVSR